VIFPESPLFVMPLSRIQFQLAKLIPQDKNFVYKPVSLPNPEYKWSINNK